ncbi:MAG: PIG-L deacetylase family protein [Candidatus Promineifilaceae bacterium]|jgi:LmbE family N-acetylglucosaminyl deacetylase
MKETYIPKRAMLIYAHPDDIEFSAAGTVARWTQAGAEVYYVVITDGNVGSHDEGMTANRLIETRRNEQRAAAEVVGAKECIFLGYHDGLLQPTLELRKELVRLIRMYKPDTIICGDPTNYFPSENWINHPDHRAAGQAALDATFPAAEMRLLYPDLEVEGLTPHKVNYVYVSSPLKEPNYYVETTETIDLKIEALRKHKSQMGDWDPEEPIKEWNAEAGKQEGMPYAERFFRITLREPESETESEAEAADE